MQGHRSPGHGQAQGTGKGGHRPNPAFRLRFLSLTPAKTTEPSAVGKGDLGARGDGKKEGRARAGSQSPVAAAFPRYPV